MAGPAAWAVIGAGVAASIIVDAVFSQKSVKKFFKDSGKNISEFFGSVGKAFSW